MATRIVGNLILSDSNQELSPSSVLAYNTETGLVSYASTGSIMPVAQSGTWTPIFSGETAGLSNVSPIQAFYSIQGDICTCSVQFQGDIDFTTFNDGSIGINTPVVIGGTLDMVGCGQLKGRKPFNIIVEDNIIRVYSDVTGITLSGAVFMVNYQFQIN